MKRARECILIFVILTLTCSAVAQGQAQKKELENTGELPETLWRDFGPVSTLNLLYGAGGKEHAPDPDGSYVFVREDLQGTSPKFVVEDGQGVRWTVKLGQEPQSETAATRLLWAAGYFVDEDYYLADLKVTGLPKLQRGQTFATPDGRVHGARLKRHLKDNKKLGHWDWFNNDFLDTREFNGLRLMMALLNNWDLSTDNNWVHLVNGERHYLVSDVGASFGNTGNSVTRSKSVLKDYAKSRFIERVTPESVDFVMHSRPLFLTVFDLPNYHHRTRMEQVTKRIPLADARWLGQRLAQLSDEQIRDCFRAADYSPQEVEGYTRVVRERIRELNELRAPLPAAESAANRKK